MKWPSNYKFWSITCIFPPLWLQASNRLLFSSCVVWFLSEWPNWSNQQYSGLLGNLLKHCQELFGQLRVQDLGRKRNWYLFCKTNFCYTNKSLVLFDFISNWILYLDKFFRSKKFLKQWSNHIILFWKDCWLFFLVSLVMSILNQRKIWIYAFLIKFWLSTKLQLWVQRNWFELQSFLKILKCNVLIYDNVL